MARRVGAHPVALKWLKYNLYHPGEEEEDCAFCRRHHRLHPVGAGFHGRRFGCGDGSGRCDHVRIRWWSLPTAVVTRAKPGGDPRGRYQFPGGGGGAVSAGGALSPPPLLLHLGRRWYRQEIDRLRTPRCRPAPVAPTEGSCSANPSPVVIALRLPRPALDLPIPDEIPSTWRCH